MKHLGTVAREKFEKIQNEIREINSKLLNDPNMTYDHFIKICQLPTTLKGSGL